MGGMVGDIVVLVLGAIGVGRRTKQNIFFVPGRLIQVNLPGCPSFRSCRACQPLFCCECECSSHPSLSRLFRHVTASISATFSDEPLPFEQCVDVYCRAQARGSDSILETLKQLSDKLGLPRGSEHRLRLLGLGAGEINAVIDKADDAQRVRLREREW